MEREELLSFSRILIASKLQQYYRKRR